MRKRILLLSSVLLTLSLITVVIFNNVDNKENNIISNINKDKQVINSNMITMMYETDAGTGIYEETKDNTWPESGYIFNDTLSGCENGGELEYNSENNTVNLLSNKSDRCYVYFDKYDGVWIDNVVATNVTGSSVTLDVSATSENGIITKYYYSLNDSEEYQEVTSNVITINDLNKLTEYKISVYAIDNTNAKSNIYKVTISTTDISVPVINSVEVSNITDSGFTLTVNATSDVGIKRYYYIIESENIAGTNTTNIYNFTNLKDSTNYSINIYVEDVNGLFSEKYSLNIKTDILTIANYIKKIYTLDGENDLYYHDANLANGASDNSYRYSGANPNNYVCFGSDATTCPTDNLYRIIGIFGNEAKLIMADYPTINQTGISGEYYGNYQSSVGSSSYYKGNRSLSSIGAYRWSSSGINTWSTSRLTTTNLNTTYLSSLNSTWQNKIATQTWYVGGYTTYVATPKTFYNAESSGITWSGKIGLMYMSDYGFAASNNYWTTTMNDYSKASSNNWMHMGLYEWPLAPRSNRTDNVYGVFNDGDISVDNVSIYHAIRPCFYLNSDVQYISGSGTSSDPIRIQ